MGMGFIHIHICTNKKLRIKVLLEKDVSLMQKLPQINRKKDKYIYIYKSKLLQSNI